ncbi:metallophosphoesterase [Bizionia sediminis]|uniref:Metallophosphoesterase n=1 Tax=Bizionia sediminis TaxID=1737064 RepID=A0ABW5KUX6_9FLAO
MAAWIIASIIFSALVFSLEFYAFQALKTITKNKAIKALWIIVTVAFYGYFIYTLVTTPRSAGQTNAIQLASGFLLTLVMPKLLLVFFMLGEDVFRILKKGYSWLTPGETAVFESRRVFIAKIALGLAAIPFASFIYGIVQGRYNYKVLKYQLTFNDLPDAFDGFKITQISDIHAGSFTNKEKIMYGIDLINKQQSDLMVFTGDLVNNMASEMDNWVSVFKSLEAPYGKYSVLGNHDYGDYVSWDSPEDKIKNFEAVKAVHPKMGFNLLLDEHRYIEKDGQRLALIGVENWGKGFNQAGDLQKASEKVLADDFKILLTHDPSHWEHQVKENTFNYQLTLSGHTHGLQMGIEIPGWFKWSPSQYIYKQWAGLYQEYGRFINVNRGFGYHAFPGRVGIWPEITVIELKKGEKNT